VVGAQASEERLSAMLVDRIAASGAGVGVTIYPAESTPA